MVLCDRCDTNLGLLFQLDFLPNEDCWHVRREQLVAEIGAVYAGESSLPVSLKRIALRARQLWH
jgi:hypothetical protein